MSFNDNNIDLSDYKAPQKMLVQKNPLRDFESAEKKNKKYIFVILVCTFLGIIFWGIYLSDIAKVSVTRGDNANIEPAH